MIFSIDRPSHQYMLMILSCTAHTQVSAGQFSENEVTLRYHLGFRMMAYKASHGTNWSCRPPITTIGKDAATLNQKQSKQSREHPPPQDIFKHSTRLGSTSDDAMAVPRYLIPKVSTVELEPVISLLLRQRQKLTDGFIIDFDNAQAIYIFRLRVPPRTPRRLWKVTKVR